MKTTPSKKVKCASTKIKNPRNEIPKKQIKRIKTEELCSLPYEQFIHEYHIFREARGLKYRQENPWSKVIECWRTDLSQLGLVYLMVSHRIPDELKNHIASYLFDDLDPIQFFYRHQNFPSTRLITTHGKNRFHVKRLPDNQVQIHCNMKGRHVCQIGKNLSFNVAQNPKYYVAFNQPKLDQKYNPRTLRSCAPIFKNLLKKLNAGLEILIKEDEGNYITADSKREVRRWIPDCSALINKFKLHATVQDYLVLKESTGGVDFFKNSPQKNKYFEITRRIDNAHEELLERSRQN